MNPLYITGLMLIVVVSCSFSKIQISASLHESGGIKLSIESPSIDSISLITIYRSATDLRNVRSLDLSYQPISKWILAAPIKDKTIMDSMIADACCYFYYVKIKCTSGREYGCATDPVSTRDRIILDTISSTPVLLIDKCNYFLELRSNNVRLKRYPVSMGSNPHNRKLHFDNQSTPEGIYCIDYRRKPTAFHAAFGVSYPNAVDRKRYAQALKNGSLKKADGIVPNIGGSIQIHGGGIGPNWTYGCIAMRNDDLDELFAFEKIKNGTKIIIVGYEWTRDSLKVTSNR
jgi:hypothetical protein